MTSSSSIQSFSMRVRNATIDCLGPCAVEVSVNPEEQVHKSSGNCLESLREELREKGWTDSNDCVISNARFPELPDMDSLNGSVLLGLNYQTSLKWNLTEEKKGQILSYLGRLVKAGAIDQSKVDAFQNSPCFKKGEHKHTGDSPTYYDVIQSMLNSCSQNEGEIRLRGGYLRHLLLEWMVEGLESLGVNCPEESKQNLSEIPPDIDILFDLTNCEVLSDLDESIVELLAKRISKNRDDYVCMKALVAFSCFKKRAFISDAKGNHFSMFSLPAFAGPDLEVLISRNLARMNLSSLDQLSIDLKPIFREASTLKKQHLICDGSLQAWQSILDNLAYLLRYEDIGTVDSYGAIRHFSHLVKGARAVQADTSKKLWNNIEDTFKDTPQKKEKIASEIVDQVRRCADNHEIGGEEGVTALVINILSSMHECGVSDQIIVEVARAFSREKESGLFETVLHLIGSEKYPLSVIFSVVCLYGNFSHWLPKSLPVSEVEHEKKRYLQLGDTKIFWLLKNDLRSALELIERYPNEAKKVMGDLYRFFPAGTKPKFKPTLDLSYINSVLKRLKLHPRGVFFFERCCFYLQPSVEGFVEIAKIVRRESWHDYLHMAQSLPLRNPLKLVAELKQKGVDGLEEVLPKSLALQEEAKCKRLSIEAWQSLPKLKKANQTEGMVLALKKELSLSATVLFEAQKQRLIPLAQQVKILCDLIQWSSSLPIQRRREVLMRLQKIGLELQKAKKTRKKKGDDFHPIESQKSLLLELAKDVSATLGFADGRILLRHLCTSTFLNVKDETVKSLAKSLALSSLQKSSFETESIYDFVQKMELLKKLDKDESSVHLALLLLKSLAKQNHVDSKPLLERVSKVDLKTEHQDKLKDIFSLKALTFSVSDVTKPYFLMIPKQTRRSLFRTWVSQADLNEAVAIFMKLDSADQKKVSKAMVEKIFSEKRCPNEMMHFFGTHSNFISDQDLVSFINLAVDQNLSENFITNFLRRLIEKKELKLAMRCLEQSEDNIKLIKFFGEFAGKSEIALSLHHLVKKRKISSQLIEKQDDCHQLILSLLKANQVEAAFEWIESAPYSDSLINDLIDAKQFDLVAKVLMKNEPEHQQVFIKIFPELSSLDQFNLAIHFGYFEHAAKAYRQISSEESAVNVERCYERLCAFQIAIPKGSLEKTIKVLHERKNSALFDLFTEVKKNEDISVISAYYDASLALIDFHQRPIEELSRLIELNQLSHQERRVSFVQACLKFPVEAFPMLEALENNENAFSKSAPLLKILTSSDNIAHLRLCYEVVKKASFHAVLEDRVGLSEVYLMLINKLLNEEHEFDDNVRAQSLLFMEKVESALSKKQFQKLKFKASKTFLVNWEKIPDRLRLSRVLELFLEEMDQLFRNPTDEEKYMPLFVDALFGLLSSFSDPVLFIRYSKVFFGKLAGSGAEQFLNRVPIPFLEFPQEMQKQIEEMQRIVGHYAMTQALTYDTTTRVIGKPKVLEQRNRVWKYLNWYVENCIKRSPENIQPKVTLIEEGVYIMECLINEFKVEKNAELVQLVYKFLLMPLPKECHLAFWRMKDSLSPLWDLAKKELSWTEHTGLLQQLQLYKHFCAPLKEETIPCLKELLVSYDALEKKLIEAKCPHKLSILITIICHYQHVIPEANFKNYVLSKYLNILNALRHLDSYHVVALKVHAQNGDLQMKTESIFDHIRDTLLNHPCFLATNRGAFATKQALQLLTGVMENFFCLLADNQDDSFYVNLMLNLEISLRVALLGGVFDNDVNQYFFFVEQLRQSISRKILRSETPRLLFEGCPMMLLFDTDPLPDENCINTIQLTETENCLRLELFERWIFDVMNTSSSHIHRSASEQVFISLKKGWFDRCPKARQKFYEFSDFLIYRFVGRSEKASEGVYTASFVALILHLFGTRLRNDRKGFTSEFCERLVAESVKTMTHYHWQAKKIAGEMRGNGNDNPFISFDQDIEGYTNWILELLEEERYDELVAHTEKLFHTAILIDRAINNIQLTISEKENHWEEMAPTAVDVQLEDSSKVVSRNSSNVMERIFRDTLEETATLRAYLFARVIDLLCENDAVKQALIHYGRVKKNWGWFDYTPKGPDIDKAVHATLTAYLETKKPRLYEKPLADGKNE